MCLVTGRNMSKNILHWCRTTDSDGWFATKAQWAHLEVLNWKVEWELCKVVRMDRGDSYIQYGFQPRKSVTMALTVDFLK